MRGSAICKLRVARGGRWLAASSRGLVVAPAEPLERTLRRRVLSLRRNFGLRQAARYKMTSSQAGRVERQRHSVSQPLAALEPRPSPPPPPPPPRASGTRVAAAAAEKEEVEEEEEVDTTSSSVASHDSRRDCSHLLCHASDRPSEARRTRKKRAVPGVTSITVTPDTPSPITACSFSLVKNLCIGGTKLWCVPYLFTLCWWNFGNCWFVLSNTRR